MLQYPKENGADKPLDLDTDFILDIALGHRQNAEAFLERPDFKDSKVFRFLILCDDEGEWKKRHMESVEHYKNTDTRPIEGEYIIDTACLPSESLKNILDIIVKFPQNSNR